MGTICNVPEGQTFTVNLLGEKSTGVRTLRIVENKGGVHIPHNGPSAKTGLPGSWDGKKAEAIKSNAKPGETGFGSTGKMGYFIGKFGTSLKLVEIPRIHSCVGMVVAAKSREKHGLDEFIAFHFGGEGWKKGLKDGYENILKTEVDNWKVDGVKRHIVIAATAGPCHPFARMSIFNDVSNLATKLKAEAWALFWTRKDETAIKIGDVPADTGAVLTVLSKGKAYTKHAKGL